MSVDLSGEVLERVAAPTIEVRDAVIWLVTDPTGPLAGCEALAEDAPAAYLLGVLYRHGRATGILYGRPAWEAEPLFAARTRTTARRALDPAAWMVALAGELGVRWEALPEVDRLWWRGQARALVATSTGTLATAWTRIKQPARLADLLTTAMVAADFIGQIRAARNKQEEP